MMTTKNGRPGVPAPKRPTNSARSLRQAPIRTTIISHGHGRSKRYSKRNDFASYEADKAKLYRAGLSPSEYEREVKALAEKWGV